MRASNLVRLLLLWCCLGVFGSALATPPPGLATVRKALTQYKVDGWQTEQGLPLNTVQALSQTRDGYLWVGTAGGLARFDGVVLPALHRPRSRRSPRSRSSASWRTRRPGSGSHTPAARRSTGRAASRGRSRAA